MIPAIIAQLDPNVNVRWRQVWADALRQVESQLGINLQSTIHGRTANCLFVGVNSDTLDNLHINGIDWYEDLREDPIKVVVGIKNYWFNGHFLPKLLANGRYLDAVINHYSQCGFEFRFERLVRLNSKQQKLFVYIKEYPGTRQGLEDYLRDVTTSGVYRRDMSPDDCIAELQRLGVPNNNENIGKLRRWRFKSYGWLEYLQITILPPIDVALLLEGDPVTVDLLKRLLMMQILTVMLLDLIYKNDHNAAAKIQRLFNRFAAWLKQP